MNKFLALGLIILDVAAFPFSSCNEDKRKNRVYFLNELYEETNYYIGEDYSMAIPDNKIIELPDIFTMEYEGYTLDYWYVADHSETGINHVIESFPYTIVEEDIQGYYNGFKSSVIIKAQWSKNEA